jgi:hypothetical protein
VISNPSSRDGKPATNRLGYGTALQKSNYIAQSVHVITIFNQQVKCSAFNKNIEINAVTNYL